MIVEVFYPMEGTTQTFDGITEAYIEYGDRNKVYLHEDSDPESSDVIIEEGVGIGIKRTEEKNAFG